MTTETRSQSAAELTLDLFPDDPAPPCPALVHGVGGRRHPRPPRRGGGGYLDGCTAAELRQEIRADIRLRELAEIGLSATWLAVAHELGYDKFVAMWRLLSSDPALRNDDDQIELRLRPFRAFERYQRNRYIATLVQAGIKPSDIHEMVRQDLGEKLSYRHIKRLAAAGRLRSAG